ncbi:DgyrCDS6901 [Dimorphilus gyrociliatus]|uniref:DgyrCDS6901 n=1 Tax=Dimorphilus gyrociliatus TaxID=2664684 RepID=A0A7I8VRP1_9ANNE|nr:DgyrCDS6901 [Dimorphilus gyrociliatus]
MAEVTKKKSSKGRFSKLFAKTDIPLKVSQKSETPAKGKNIMFTSGRKTWKEKEEKAKEKESSTLNFQLPGPGRVKENEFVPEYSQSVDRPYKPVPVPRPTNNNTVEVHNDTEGFNELHVFSSKSAKQDVKDRPTSGIVVNTTVSMEEVLAQKVENPSIPTNSNSPMNFEHKTNKKGAVSLLAIKDEEDIVIQTSPPEIIDTKQTKAKNDRPIVTPSVHAGPSPALPPSSTTSPTYPVAAPRIVTSEKDSATLIQTSSTVEKSETSYSTTTTRTTTDASTVKAESKSNGNISDRVDLAKISYHCNSEIIECNRTASFRIMTPQEVYRNDLKVTILDAENNDVSYYVRSSDQGGYHVEYTPIKPCGHVIRISYKDEEIFGSPFKIKAFNPGAVTISKMEKAFVGESFSFTIKTDGAGSGKLAVKFEIDGKTVPNTMKKSNKEVSSYIATFTPEVARVHDIFVTFNDESIPGSPFTCKVFDKNEFTVEGKTLDYAPINKMATLVLKTPPNFEDPNPKIDFYITSPNGYVIDVNKKKISQNAWEIQYIPIEVGKYVIKCSVSDIEIKSSPFTTEVYDLSQIKVKGIKTGLVGKPVSFEVNAARVGEGTLTVHVETKNHKTVSAKLYDRGNGIFEIVFVPIDETPHNVDIEFNEELVEGSPFVCHIFDNKAVRVNWDSVYPVPINKHVQFDINIGEAKFEDIFTKIFNPLGGEEESELSQSGNSLTVAFIPKMIGNYIVIAQCAGRKVADSPFTCSVYDVSRVKLQAIEVDGRVGDELSFVVDTSEAGDGDLDVEVLCLGQLVKTIRQKLDNTHHKYKYRVERIHNHFINVMFNLRPVPDCPREVTMLDQTNYIYIDQETPNLVPAHKMNWLRLLCPDVPLSVADLTIDIHTPNGDPMPYKFSPEAPGKYLLEYSPVQAGNHVIEVLYGENYVGGEPFQVHVYDPTKVLVEYSKSGTVTKESELKINIAKAGNAELGLTIHSPKSEVVPYSSKEVADGFKISYSLSEAGAYKVYITLGDIHVPGAPFITNAVDREEGAVEVSGDGLIQGYLGRPSEFKVVTNDVVGDLDIIVADNKTILDNTFVKDDNNNILVTFTPKILGEHRITIMVNKKNVPGSPWTPNIIDPNKIEVVGGWESHMDYDQKVNLIFGEKKTIEFLAEAPGTLIGEVRGPTGNLAVENEDIGNGRYTISFTPDVAGEYYITAKWNGIIVAGCPQMGFATSQEEVDSNEVSIRGKGLNEARLNEDAEFIIDGKRLRRTNPEGPQVDIVGVRTALISKVTRLLDGRYKCSYKPKHHGAYLVYIKWGESEVQGSPFKLDVKRDSDASKVVCDYEKLESATLETESVTVIDTKNAGNGELVVKCEGLTREALCQLLNQRDGTFNLLINAQEPGKHMLHITYADVHIPGSPYEMNFVKTSDATKVRVFGQGIENGILPTFVSSFTVETEGAGPGRLSVKVKGPRKAFKVNLRPVDEYSRTILCDYEPTETGLYLVSVMWTKHHVAGSPFKVRIFDTADELNKFLKNNPQERGNANTLLRHF